MESKNKKPAASAANEENLMIYEEEVLAEHSKRRSVDRSPPTKISTPKSTTVEGDSASWKTESTKEKRVESPKENNNNNDKGEEDAVSKIRSIRDELRAFLLKDSSKVNKSVLAYVLSKWSETEDILMDVVAQKEQLKSKVEQNPKRTDPSVIQQMSYAGAVSMPPVPGGRRHQKSNVVILRPVDSGKYESSEKVKETVVSKVLRDMKTIKIKNIRKIRDKGLLIETETEKDLKLIQASKKINEEGLKIEEPRKIGPKLLIFDVSKEMKDSDILEEIYHRNVAEKGMTQEEFKKDVRVRFRTGDPKKKDSNVIVEVSGKIRSILMAYGKIFMGCGAHRIKDFDLVTRCFKCLQYGHISKYCKAEMACRHCAESGHAFKDCPNKKGKSKCLNCKLRKKDYDHSTMDKTCPEYKRALDFSRTKVSYD